MRDTMLASLNAYLTDGVPPLKLTWLLDIPDTAAGAHPVRLRVGDDDAGQFDLIFGRNTPPPPKLIHPTHPAIKSITVNYPRPLQKATFWTPLTHFNGPRWDFGWLSIYLLAYLPLMFLSKAILRVP